MIDYVKIALVGVDVRQLEESKILDLRRVYSESTGEGENKRTATFHFMKLVIYDSGYMELRGSLHKAFNSISGIGNPGTKGHDRGFNGNQFCYTQLCYVVRFLQDVFGFDARRAVIKNAEFGVNLSHHFNTRWILTGLFLHTGVSFSEPIKYCMVANHSEYRVKCYFKSKQYGMKENILRFELHYTKMRKLNSFGISHLADLLNIALLGKLRAHLVQMWNEILMFDYTIRETGLELKHRRWIPNYKRSGFWINDLRPHRRYGHKKVLREIVRLHSDEVQKTIGVMIDENWQRLNLRCETYRRLFEKKRNDSPFR